MEICDKKSYYLLSLNIPTITEDSVNAITDLIADLTKPVVIDMNGVETCVNAFYQMFKKYDNITLLNIDLRLLSTIFMTGFDKYVKIYGETVSFEDKSRELVNRKLCIV